MTKLTPKNTRKRQTRKEKGGKKVEIMPLAEALYLDGNEKNDNLGMLTASSKERNARLTAQEERQLFKIINGNYSPERKHEAQEIIIRKSQGYVIKLAKRYVQRGVEIEDLIQEGNIGLMQAIERFDITRGFRFLTYADDWVRRSLGRSAEEKGSVNIYQVRTPCYMYLAIGRINKNLGKLRQKLNREPTNKELAKICGVTEKVIEQALNIMRRKIDSLDKTVDTGDSDASVSETVAAEPGCETEYVAMQHENARLLDKALNRLTEEERRVIELRFGLRGEQKHTQDQVWKVLNINRTKVATIQQRALNKLRGMPELADLVDVLDEN